MTDYSNYVPFDEALASLDRLKKSIAETTKGAIERVYSQWQKA